MKIGGNDRIVGMKVRCQVVKNRMGPPLRSTDFEIYFDRGIDNYGSWLKVMKDENLVKQAGAWYTYTDTETGEEHKFQSKDFILMMTENLELRDQIYKKICESQNHFYKIYPKDVLLDSFEKIEIRLNLVKSVSQYFFDYEWTESNLILKSQLFKGKHQPLDKPQLNLLAIYLDDIHSKDIFHGDIHVRNIFIHNDKPILVDWEPCTLQQINSKKIIKSHSRGIAIKDRKNKKISPLTDKKGFLKLISEKAFNQLADTPEMENLTCLELLDKCHQPSPSS